MKSLHLGHHFYGAGNRGDDLMLAGFLASVPAGWRLTCAVPHPHEPLRRRFPEVEWLPYTAEARHQAIAESVAWLGLGGSPFQSASRWFADHLGQEESTCRETGKPMYLLGVGGQDPAAFALPEIRRVLARAVRIWTRDRRTAEAAVAAGAAQVTEAADLAHIYLEQCPPPVARPGRLTTVLNVDHASWPALDRWVLALNGLEPAEKVWAVQEERPLPGGELDLFAQLPPALRAGWVLMRPPTADTALGMALAGWPSGERLLSSRFHGTLAGAWAGSRAVIVAINEKLRSAADETGFPVLPLDANPAQLATLFERSQPVPRARLIERAALARRACREFFAAV